MNFDIKILTNVTDGGTPDIGDVPTSGLLSDLITEATNLSDELVSLTDVVTMINNRNGKFYLGDDIVQTIQAMIKTLKTEQYKLQQMTYGDYHDYVRPLPTELNNSMYGIEYPY